MLLIKRYVSWHTFVLTGHVLYMSTSCTRRSEITPSKVAKEIVKLSSKSPDLSSDVKSRAWKSLVLNEQWYNVWILRPPPYWRIWAHNSPLYRAVSTQHLISQYPLPNNQRWLKGETGPTKFQRINLRMFLTISNRKEARLKKKKR